MLSLCFLGSQEAVYEKVTCLDVVLKLEPQQRVKLALRRFRV